MEPAQPMPQTPPAEAPPTRTTPDNPPAQKAPTRSSNSVSDDGPFVKKS